MTTAERFPPHPAAYPAAARRPAERLAVVDKIQTAAVFYIGAWAISPPLFANDWARMAAIAMFGLWFLAELSRGGGVILRPTRGVLIALFYLVYTTAIAIYADGSASLSNRIQTGLFVLFFIFFCAAKKHGLAKYRWVLWASLALLSVWMLITVDALKTDNHIARAMVRTSEDTLQYSAEGIGGYALVYAALWAIAPLVYLVANMPRLPARRPGAGRGFAIVRIGVAIGSLALSCMLVLGSGYSIAVISFLMGAVAYWLLRGRASGRWLRITVAILLAVVALALSQTSMTDRLLDGLSSVTEGTNYHLKVEDLRASMESEAAVGTVNDRTQRYIRSAQLFIQSPLGGVKSVRDVGKHSVLLDNLAQFGLMGGLAFLYILFALPLTLMRASSRQPALAGAAFAFMVVVGICAVLNDISASMGFVAFLLYPLAMSYQPRPRVRRRAMAPSGFAGYRSHLGPAVAKRP